MQEPRVRDTTKVGIAEALRNREIEVKRTGTEGMLIKLAVS